MHQVDGVATACGCLCTEVQDLKTLLGVLPIWSSGMFLRTLDGAAWWDAAGHGDGDVALGHALGFYQRVGLYSGYSIGVSFI
jgi:hypothetical protein